MQSVQPLSGSCFGGWIGSITPPYYARRIIIFLVHPSRLRLYTIPRVGQIIYDRRQRICPLYILRSHSQYFVYNHEYTKYSTSTYIYRVDIIYAWYLYILLSQGTHQWAQNTKKTNDTSGTPTQVRRIVIIKPAGEIPLPSFL